MEAAFALAAVVVVLVLCIAGLFAVALQLRCVDAAREAARLAARGDDRAAVEAARTVAPEGAAVQVRVDGPWVWARVSTRAPLLPGLTIAAEAMSAVEPG